MNEFKYIDKNLFWSKVNIGEPNDCWEWLASTTDTGYGQFWNGYTMIRSHRLAWYLHNGSIPKGLCILHKCDNKKCVNPNHLYCGTQQQNTQDSLKRTKKIFIGDPPKINQSDKEKIKYLYKNEELSQKEIGRIFDVHQSHVSRIINGIE